MVRLLDPTSGTIRFEGRDITRLSPASMRPLRREMQMIFQDPYSSLNPRKTRRPDHRRAVRDPQDREGRRNARSASCSSASGSARSTTTATRTSSRAASASGSASPARSRSDPKLIVCDEPVSALDVSVQAQILNLLKSLQEELGLTYVFISHDLAVIRQISDRIAVMYLGRVVESATSELLYEHPRHPYTAALLSAVPRPETSGATAARTGSCSPATSPRPSTRRRVPLPSPLPALPAGHCDVETPGAALVRRRSRGRLPLPGRALADDRGRACGQVGRSARSAGRQLNHSSGV